MKIAITGHTSGIGKAISDLFIARGDTVQGFSRSTGHDLRSPMTITHIVTAAAEADVFINNAYFAMAQISVLYAMYDQWKDMNKTILSIGSTSGDGVKRRHPYSIHKSALDDTVTQLQNTDPRCRLMNLRPGYVDTPRVTHVQANKLDPVYVAGIAVWMIDQPGLIKSLTVVH